MNAEDYTKRPNGKYDIASLVKINPKYNMKYQVTQADVDITNSYVAMIERTRSPITPESGDILRYTDRHGNYYPHAFIQDNRNGICHICERPYGIFISPIQKESRCDASGGAWRNIETACLRYIGKEETNFYNWGRLGYYGNGVLNFTAEVSVWEYIHPEPLYKDYTTEKWRKLYLVYSEEKHKYLGGQPYYSLGDTGLHTESDLRRFLNEFKGEAFKGREDNELVIWCYKQLQEQVSQEEFESLDLPETTTFCNGNQPAKIKYDDENKTAIFYFIL